MIDCRVLVQARMSSSRFPGKMLAPLAGKPLITNLIARLCEAVPADRVIVVTSEADSDDPLALYVREALGVAVHRGSVDDVAGRFQACLRAHPCEWFVRVSGDSPVIDPGLLEWMLQRVPATGDLLTNVAERTFPSGESIEIVRTSTFLNWTVEDMRADEREHVTRRFYLQPERYRIHSVVAGDPSFSDRRMSVDTIEDLRALEVTLARDPGLTRGYSKGALLRDQA